VFQKGPASKKLNQGNKNTYAALIKVMKMYRDEPTLLHPKEFVILANYYHYLHEQCQEVDTWNWLKWYEYYENPYAAIQSPPLKMVTWKCPNQYYNGPEEDWKNVQKLCPYCLQVPPACIKWLVDHNASKMFSHVFAIKGSTKTVDDKWVEEDDWLREHHEEYDALYQQTDMEEEERVEHEYREHQCKRIQEQSEKTKSTMRGTLQKMPGRSVRTSSSTRWATTSPNLKILWHRTSDKSVY
jgi:hypothetical protein